MPFTRAQATALLNASEMRLFDDSRANAVRGFDKAALDGRITRTRAARDRARDLLKRQRAAARKRGEGRDEGIAARTARKEALLVELLERFVQARRAAAAAPAKKAATRSVAGKRAGAQPANARRASGRKPDAAETTTKKTAAKKTAVKKTAVKKTAVKEAAPKQTAASKAEAKKATAKKATAKKPAVKTSAGAAAMRRASEAAEADSRGAAAATASPGRKASAKPQAGSTSPDAGAKPKRKTSRRLTPEAALRSTRRLLEEKQERARTPPPWQSLGPGSQPVAPAGYQSPQAAARAVDLHAAEARMASIHGSQSTHDRHNQGKRDHRGDTD